MDGGSTLWVMLALALPGVLVTARLFPRAPALDRWTLGAVLGLAAALHVAFVLAHLPPPALGAFPVVWGALAAGALLAWLTGERSSLLARPDGTAIALALVVALSAFVRFVPTLRHVVPPGWDPAFHLLLARKVDVADAVVRDWSPFAEVALHYPLGTHVLTVVLARASGAELHSVFKLLIPAFGTLSVPLVAVLARRVSGRASVGLLAGAAYGLWALMGSVGYYRWGGLPNQVGMTFLLGVLCWLSEARTDRRHAAVIGVLLAAIACAHHHVLVTSALVLGVLFAVLARRRDARAATLVLAALFALVLSHVHVVPFLMKIAFIGGTKTLGHGEPFLGWTALRAGLGTVFSISVVLGFGWLAAVRPRLQGGLVLGVTLTVLLTMFVALEYGVRAWWQLTAGVDRTALGPSRFLTDAVPLLAVVAGLGLERLARTLRAPLVLVVAAVIALAATNLDAWGGLLRPGVERGRWAAFEWIRTKTPSETIVLNQDPWAAYATWRRCTYVPLPRSEPETSGTPLRRALSALLDGERPARFEGDPVVAILDDDPGPGFWRDGKWMGAARDDPRRRLGAWFGDEARVADRVQGIRPDFPPREPVLWEDAASGLRVVEVWPGRTPLRPRDRGL